MAKRPLHVIPRVRVVHICPPLVVHTDLSNFRTTVQELTGLRRRAVKTVLNDGHQTHEDNGTHVSIFTSNEGIYHNCKIHDEKRGVEACTNVTLDGLESFHDHNDYGRSSNSDGLSCIANNQQRSLQLHKVDRNFDNDNPMLNRVTTAVTEGTLAPAKRLKLAAYTDTSGYHEIFNNNGKDIYSMSYEESFDSLMSTSFYNSLNDRFLPQFLTVQEAHPFHS